MIPHRGFTLEPAKIDKPDVNIVMLVAQLLCKAASGFTLQSVVRFEAASQVFTLQAQ